MFRLSNNVRLKHDIPNGNYFLFCIKTGRHVRLNAMSYEIAVLLKNGISNNSINEYVSNYYEIDKEICSNDINDFLKFLFENEMVYVVD